MFGRLTLLRTPILTFHCPDVVSTSRRNAEHTINKFERWKELVSPLQFLWPLEAWVLLLPLRMYRKLASMLVEKWNISYSRCLFWVRYRLCFSLFRSDVMCLRGQQSTKSHPVSAILFWLILRVTLMLGPSSELFQMLVSSSCPALNSWCWGWQPRAVHQAQEKNSWQAFSYLMWFKPIRKSWPLIILCTSTYAQINFAGIWILH